MTNLGSGYAKVSLCSSLLGSASFVEEITAAHVTTKEADRNIPALRQLIIRPSPEEIITGVKAIFSGNERLARQASIYLCHKYSGMKLREIGRLFDMRETAISEASRRFSLKMGNDEKVLNLVRMVEGMLKI